MVNAVISFHFCQLGTRPNLNYANLPPHGPPQFLSVSLLATDTFDSKKI